MRARSRRSVERGDIGFLFLIILGSIGVCLLTLLLDWVRETKSRRGTPLESVTFEQAPAPNEHESDRFSVVP
jgi:hypothetical protein